MNFNQIDDEILIRLISQSDKEISEYALSELYDRYSRLVYSLAIKIVGDNKIAEEIIQDVFLSVWNKANTYRLDEAKVRTWLTSIARNRAIDVLRKQRVRPEHYSIGWDDVSYQSFDTLKNPEETTEENIRRNRIHDAIKILPEEQRKALTLSYFYGMSHSEISEKLNVPLGTIKTRIRLAMQKLRDHLLIEN